MKTTVIIGGGLGGLFAGAILSREGFKVTVLEKNDTAGGGLQNFRRFGMKFDTGMHVIGGMRPGGNIYRTPPPPKRGVSISVLQTRCSCVTLMMIVRTVSTLLKTRRPII